MQIKGRRSKSGVFVLLLMSGFSFFSLSAMLLLSACHFPPPITLHKWIIQLDFRESLLSAANKIWRQNWVELLSNKQTLKMESDTNWSNQMRSEGVFAQGLTVEGALDCLSDPWMVAFGLIA